MKLRASLLRLATLSLALAACADAAPKAETVAPSRERPASAAAPKEPAPTVPGVRSAPPPAWIETRRGDRWLAFFSYCWTTTCIDSRPVEQRPDVPTIRVARGETVRFHLGFRPSSLTLRVGTKSYRLQPRQVTSWRVSAASGVLKLTGRVSGRRAEYVAHLVVR